MTGSSPIYEDPYCRTAWHLPYVALVRVDGTEDPTRVAWTGTYFDAERQQVRGDDVHFGLVSMGKYDRYRIYSRSGTLVTDGPLGETYKEDGGTMTLGDLCINLITG